MNRGSFDQLWGGVALLCLGALASPPARAAAPSSVRIVRDTYGVPHIFAATTYGLYFGFGHALAEDQLYQIEILKRVARGRVAEVLGSAYLAGDRQARIRIDIASLDRQYRALPAADQAIFAGMADGLNAGIDRILRERATLLPKPFLDANFLPERWTPLDILAVYEHSMVARFSDLNAELDNLALLTRLRRAKGAAEGSALFDQLRPIDDPTAPTSIAAGDERVRAVPTFAAPGPKGVLPNRLVGLRETTLYASLTPGDVPHASNAWIASPRWTGTGETVLVNGPQMGNFATSYIWAVGLHGAGFDMVGSGPVGSPWLVFGTNGKIGWGATAGLGDTVDIYQERLSPRDPHLYRFNGRWLAMTRRVELIKVRDGADVTLPVWSTVHGVVDLQDEASNVAYSRRRTWAGREVGSLVAWIRATQAGDYPTWRARVAKVAIAINNYYVDRRGTIAYQFLGLFPNRPRDQDARLPATGDGSMEWRGTQSTLQNPYVVDPASGFLANWNNKPQPTYASGDFLYWSRVDRVREIQEAAKRATAHDAKGLWDLVEATSFVDVSARYFVELIRTNRAELAGVAPEAATLLGDWDGRLADRATARATPAYLLYQAFLAALMKHVFTPVLPEAGPARVAAEHDWLRLDSVFPTMGAKIAFEALSAGHDSPLLAGRRPADLLGKALREGWRQATAAYGARPGDWNVPATAHVFEATNYAGVPIAPRALTLPIFMNRGTENDRIVFKQGFVSYCDVAPPGQSGFVAPDGRPSPHAQDQLDLYRGFACKRQWLAPAEVMAHATASQTISFALPPRFGAVAPATPPAKPGFNTAR